jgi:hypothetical protein
MQICKRRFSWPGAPPSSLWLRWICQRRKWRPQKMVWEGYTVALSGLPTITMSLSLSVVRVCNQPGMVGMCSNRQEFKCRLASLLVGEDGFFGHLLYESGMRGGGREGGCVHHPRGCGREQQNNGGIPGRSRCPRPGIKQPSVGGRPNPIGYTNVGSQLRSMNTKSVRHGVFLTCNLRTSLTLRGNSLKFPGTPADFLQKGLLDGQPRKLSNRFRFNNKSVKSERPTCR